MPERRSVRAPLRLSARPDRSILHKVRVWNWARVRCVPALGALALVVGCRAQMLTGPVDSRGMEDAAGPLDAGSSPPGCTSSCCDFVPPNCPPTAPTAGTPCGQPSFYDCEYGDDPFIGCNTVMTCTATGWTQQQSLPTPATGCPTGEPSCPSSFASAADGGVTCPDYAPNLICGYPEGFCVCNGGWDCSPLANECPATRPRAGTPCDPDGGGCQSWGVACTGDAMRCACGIWSPVFCIETGG